LSTELHPDYPVVSGDFVLIKGWRIDLPEKFNRRVEDGSLVLWRPDLTFWINVWNNDHQRSIEELLQKILLDVSPARSDEQIERVGGVSRLTYELAEQDLGREQPGYRSINGYVISDEGYVQISAYYDTPQARNLGYRIIHVLGPDY
jgi:hypothetical protein